MVGRWKRVDWRLGVLYPSEGSLLNAVQTGHRFALLLFDAASALINLTTGHIKITRISNLSIQQLKLYLELTPLRPQRQSCRAIPASDQTKDIKDDMLLLRQGRPP